MELRSSKGRPLCGIAATDARGSALAVRGSTFSAPRPRLPMTPREARLLREGNEDEAAVGALPAGAAVGRLGSESRPKVVLRMFTIG
jgi:hypothetical protein